MRKPDFNNLLKVLKRERPERPTLFEFFLNYDLYCQLAPEAANIKDEWHELRLNTKAFEKAGYDYVTLQGSGFDFKKIQVQRKNTKSLNEGSIIIDEESLERYHWNHPENYNYSRLEKVKEFISDGMKVIVYGPGGVLENVIELVGYDNLCMMMFEEPELVQEIFDNVGSRLLKYYEMCLQYETVGAIISNDDWGFNTQTLLSPLQMKRFVYPWHEKIVKQAHNAGRPVILHSCGNFRDIWDDVIDDLKYDAKHSFEDVIMPVEDCYDNFGHRIAIMGGIDVNFICRATPEEIEKRCIAMLERTWDKGGYALGTGNSVPDYIPVENYFAMINSINKL